MSNLTATGFPQREVTALQTTKTSIPSVSTFTDPALLQTLAQQGSPIVILLLLIWLFKVLIEFVKTCREVR